MKALLSVSDKTGIIELATFLHELGVELISTGGTLQVLQSAGLPAVGVESITHFPEMMDGRVKTLHPCIHGALLAKRDNDSHLQAAKTHGIPLIDLVIVNLYPFAATIQRPDSTRDEAIEQIDIGGPSMIRSAAKNMASVTVVVSPDSYPILIEELRIHGNTTIQTRQELATKAFQHTAAYDAMIAGYLSGPTLFPDTLNLSLTHHSSLRYGENPHQAATLYQSQTPPNHLAAMTQLSGKELSYNNWLDMNAAYQLVCEFQKPTVAIIKHTNPCGVATGNHISDAYRAAHDADSQSAFGSVVGLNREVDDETAKQIVSTFVEVVVAPHFTEKAIDILKKKTALRLIVIPNFGCSMPRVGIRQVCGGILVQEMDHVTDPTYTTPTVLQPSTSEVSDLEFAMLVVKHVKSNAIVVAKNGVTLGIGAGQMSRVDSVKIALEKSRGLSNGAVLASDAFFPFRDSVDLAASAGIRAIIQPGGSIRDHESVDACNEHGIAMLFTGIRHFLH